MCAVNESPSLPARERSPLESKLSKLNETVDAEVEALPEDLRARLARIALLIEEKGLERMGEPHVKHIEGRLWEMRLKGRSGISRALYVTGRGQTRGDRAGLYQEDGEDATARARSSWP